MQTTTMKYTVSLSFFAVLLAVFISAISSQTNKDDRERCKTVNFFANDSFFRCYTDPSDKKMAELQENLSMDQALVTIGHKMDKAIAVYAQTDVCYECPCINITTIDPGSNVTCEIETSFPVEFAAVYASNITQQICSTYSRLTQHGKYELWVSEDDCNFFPTAQPSNPYIPIYVAMGILTAAGLLYQLFERLYRKGYLYRIAICMPYERLINSDLGTPSPGVPPEESQESEEDNARPPPKRRLRSLDTFRGLSLVVMIFVNYKGGGYWFFHHSAWNGLTVADLVFPWFTFIMGTSIALAFKSLVLRGAGKLSLIWKVVKRTIILFTLGLLISNGGGEAVRLESLRIPGVLQRLALTYCVVALMQVFFAARGQPVLGTQASFKRVLQDVLPYWPEWIISLAILSLHIFLTSLLKVPGCPTGYIGPGGLHKYPHYFNCTGGAAGYIDRKVLGELHIYRHPTCKIPYQTSQPYDPEGILGTLTSIFICFLGLQAGKTIVVYKSHMQRISRWLVWSLITGAIAGGLCAFSQQGGLIPFNKNLWSVSFILGLSSMAFLLLTACYILIDVLELWSGAPVVFPGMNSIVIYMCHEVFHSYFPVQWAVPNTHAAQLAMSLYGTALWTIIAAVLYYKDVFIAI